MKIEFEEEKENRVTLFLVIGFMFSSIGAAMNVTIDGLIGTISALAFSITAILFFIAAVIQWTKEKENK